MHAGAWMSVVLEMFTLIRVQYSISDDRCESSWLLYSL